MTKMINLWEETMEVISRNNHRFEDVLFIFCRDGVVPLRDFEYYARAMNYDSGYGTEYVDTSLTIVFGDGRMERKNYDGSEWWEFISYSVTVPNGLHRDDLFDNDYARKSNEEEMQAYSTTKEQDKE